MKKNLLLAAGLVLAIGLANTANASVILQAALNEDGVCPASPGSWQAWATDRYALPTIQSHMFTGGITCTLDTTDVGGYGMQSRSGRGASANNGTFTLHELYDGWTAAFVTGIVGTGMGVSLSGTGIAANTTYQMTVYAYDASTYMNQSVDFTTDAAGTQFVNGTKAASTISWSAGHVFTTNDGYASLNFDITSDGTGKIKFYDLVAASGSGMRLDGFQLNTIPEPATLSLLGLFGGAFLLRLRRRNK